MSSHGAGHRADAPPARRWVQLQSWRKLLFAHWPVPAAALRPHVPTELEIEEFDGTAWLGVVPFRITDMRLRWLPALPGLASMNELNLRTYVSHRGRPGVWFFSLDATSALGVAGGRTWYALPYFRARMSLHEAAGDVVVAHERTHRGAHPSRFAARYRATGPAAPAARGTLAHFLTERYRLFARDRRGVLWRAEIHHGPWPLQEARAELEAQAVAATLGVALPAVAPHLAYAERQDTQIWTPERA